MRENQADFLFFSYCVFQTFFHIKENLLQLHCMLQNVNASLQKAITQQVKAETILFNAHTFQNTLYT